MSDLPSTIKHPHTFNQSPSAGFDGVFDWEWTQGCFGSGRITPMDFDGVVERKGNFIVFETKAPGVPIPDGQLFTLKRAHQLGVFTIMLIHGKTVPEASQVWCPPDFKNGKVMDDFREITVTRAREFVSEWYQYADKNPRQKVDHTILNRRIEMISNERDELAQKIVFAVSLLKKAAEILSIDVDENGQN